MTGRVGKTLFSKQYQSEKLKVPRKKLKGRNPLPWITGNILNLINKKNTEN